MKRMIVILCAAASLHAALASTTKKPGTVRFALCQTIALETASEECVENVFAWVRDRLSGDEDVIVLPEMAFTTFSQFPEAWRYASAVWRKAAEFAVEQNAWVFVNHPSRTAGEGSPLVNETRVFSPAGEVAATYRKRVLANMDVAAGFSPGSETVVADLPFARIGLLICKDAHYPSIGGAGYVTADMILVQFSHPGVDNREAPEAAGFPTSRQSLEYLRNERFAWSHLTIPFVAVNKTGPDGNYVLCGGTFASDSSGEVLAGLETDAGIVFADYPLRGDGRIDSRAVIGGLAPATDFVAMEIGATEMFSVVANDPEGDDVVATWHLCDKDDGVYVFVGDGLSYGFTPAVSGNYGLKVEVSARGAESYLGGLWNVRVFPEDAADYGEIAGSGLVWFIAGATLTICGNGPMPSFAETDPPYKAYADGIGTIVVENGVTGVGDSAFARCANAGFLYLPSALFGDVWRLGAPASCNIIGTDIRDFVARLYRLCLGREPDMEGCNDWCLQLASGANDGANVAYGFFMSQEMANRGLSDEEYVETLYNVMMGRASDEGGKTYWLDALAGGVSRVGVFRGFAESAEFMAVCGGYGILRGGIAPAILEARDLNAGVTLFVARCYTKALGRAYDIPGLNAWCGMIVSSPDKRAAAIHVATAGFFDSQEFQNRRLGNEAFVDVLYQTFLGRAADPPGKAGWVAQLDAGADRHAVMAGFYNSAEFSAIMAQYGL